MKKKLKFIIAGVFVCSVLLILLALYFNISMWILAGIILSAGLVYGIKVALAWRSGGKLIQAINTQTTDEHLLEVSALQEKMKEAIEKLRASGVHAGYRGAAALYALPWYMIIGPSAAGKSTLLRNSNLNFPYSANDQIDIKGFAGTRNCDWWFADEAIILDTAGRYTMEETDKPEWLAFLELLRKFRRRAPINGVIVTLSLEEILSSNKQTLIHHCQLIRQKLDELNQQLGIVIPVQFVVTKCDLLPGFSQFFKDLSTDAREQAWGVRLSGNDFQTGLSRLIDKLSDWRLHKLGMSVQLEHKHAIMSFPVEFEEAVEKVILFLENLTHKNHFQEQPDFKGVYFTSALQEKSDDSTVRSYFIKDLFRKIIFQQRKTAKNAHVNKVHARLKFGGGFAAVTLFVTAFWMLNSGYRTQSDLYMKQDMLMNTLGSRSSYDQLSGLLKVYQHYDSLKKIESENWWRFTIGFNSLDKQIKKDEALFAAYFTPFMARPAQESLAKMIDSETKGWSSLNKESQANHYAGYYDKLKTYLMLGAPDKLDPVFGAKAYHAAWEYYVTSQQPAIPLGLSATPTEPMFQAYLTLVKKGAVKQPLAPVNPEIIQAARDTLYMPPDAQLLYQHLVSRGIQELGVASVQDVLAGQEQGLISAGYQLPKMYTKAAFESSVLPMMVSIAGNAGTGDWVLQNNTISTLDKVAQDKWVHELRALYFQDYTHQWMQWLASLEIKDFNSLDDASAKLLKLQREDGPLVAVVKQIDQNFNWGIPELVSANAAFAQIVAKDTLTDYLSQLAIIQTDMSALSASSDPLRDAEAYARKVLAETGQTSLATAMNTVNGMSNLGPEQKAALTSFLASPIEKSWRTVLNSAGTYIQIQWDAEVVAAYNHSLRGKFPFAQTSMEVAVDDVTNFFNPNDGVLSQFTLNVLKPYLKQAKGGWAEHQWMGQGIGFSTAFLKTLAQGDQITHALFRPGSADPKFTFYIQPVAVPGIEEIIFDSNGQEYRYRNEPEEWRRFTWPGEASQIGARLYASANQNKFSAEIEHQGLWGLFHLLSNAKLIKQGGTQYLTEWKLKDRSGQTLAVKMKIKADKQSNVLDPRIMTQFKLPELIKNNQGARG